MVTVARYAFAKATAYKKGMARVFEIKVENILRSMCIAVQSW
jgi:hypothetical protein